MNEADYNQFVLDTAEEEMNRRLENNVPVSWEVDPRANTLTIRFEDKDTFHGKHTTVNLECTRCGWEMIDTLQSVKYDYTVFEYDCADSSGKHVICPECDSMCAPELSHLE